MGLQMVDRLIGDKFRELLMNKVSKLNQKFILAYILPFFSVMKT